MAPAPFVINMVILYQDGFTDSIPLTATDVTTNNWVWPDGLSQGNISGAHGNAIIKDMVLSSGGEDCRTSNIDVNSRRIPDIVLHGANVGTVVSRQFQQTPLRLPAGCKLEFTQLT